MAKKPSYMKVMSRLNDGWAYVVSLRGGDKRYVHASIDLEGVVAMWEQALKDGAAVIFFDGAGWQEEDGPEGACGILTSDIQAVALADPITIASMDEALRLLSPPEGEGDPGPNRDGGQGTEADAEGQGQGDAEALRMLTGGGQ